VDVASLLVPNGSDIVSARGRGFPGVTYRSRVDPILDPNTKLAVLINRGTASAAEIVSGAVQDLDRGVIVGGDRTFGKGLVQNVEDLPFNTALKFTVAKYYTRK
jgi:carboxyl-terminal processing protease